MEYTVNKHGIRVNKGCFSCAHKGYDESDNEVRICKLDHEAHPRCYQCPHWEMHPGLQKAGEGGGEVKCLAYLMHVAKIRAQEGRKDEPRDVIEIRAEYEREYGSIHVKLRDTRKRKKGLFKCLIV